MNDLATFLSARPAMIVGHAFDDCSSPLGLGEPFALNGGDRLGPDGIAFELMHEHQSAFLRWVSANCETLIATGRPWFRGNPVLATGPVGAGRTHAARWLARVAGVPHVIINLTDPVIATNIASSGRVTEALWASPVTVAMAARRCANPVVSVIGIDKVGDDVAAGLVAMIDPATGRSWSEDCLETHVDFGEVTWIVQCDDLTRVPPSLRALAAHIAFEKLPRGKENTAVLSVMLEVIRDLDLDEADPALAWPHVARRLSGYHTTTRQLYAEMTDAVRWAARGEEPDPDFDVPY